MAKLILKKCGMVIRLRVGYMPDGRERCETVRLNGIRPDAGAEQLAAAVRALEPLLDGVITEVRRATEYILEWKGERGEKAAPAAIHAPLINAEERPKFPSSPKKTHSAFSGRRHSAILDIGGM